MNLQHTYAFILTVQAIGRLVHVCSTAALRHPQDVWTCLRLSALSLWQHRGLLQSMQSVGERLAKGCCNNVIEGGARKLVTNQSLLWLLHAACLAHTSWLEFRFPCSLAGTAAGCYHSSRMVFASNKVLVCLTISCQQRMSVVLFGFHPDCFAVLSHHQHSSTTHVVTSLP
jgi:hypothetical protein